MPFMMDLYNFPKTTPETAFVRFFSLSFFSSDTIMCFSDQFCMRSYAAVSLLRILQHFSNQFYITDSAIKDYITCANNATSCRQAHFPLCLTCNIINKNDIAFKTKQELCVRAHKTANVLTLKRPEHLFLCQHFIKFILHMVCVVVAISTCACVC